MYVLPFHEKEKIENDLCSSGLTSPLIRYEEKGQAIARKILSLCQRGERIVFVVSPSANGCALLVATRALLASGFVPVVGVIGNRGKSLPVGWGAALRRLRSMGLGRLFSLDTQRGWEGFVRVASEGDRLITCVDVSGWKAHVSREAFGEWTIRNMRLLIGIELPFGYPDAPVPMHETWCWDFPAAEIVDYPGGNFAGDISCLATFFPQKFLDESGTGWRFAMPGDVSELVRTRRAFTHKGSYGRALLFGGSLAYPGAIQIAAQGALHSGCGLVTIAKEHNVEGSTPEATYLPLPKEKEIETIESYLQRLHTSTILVGNGWDENEKHAQMLRFILHQPYAHTIVIDAGALNLLARFPDTAELLSAQNKTIVLTPHVGEAVRLARVSSEDFRKKRYELVLEMSRTWNVIMLQKDSVSLTATPDGELWFSCFGNHALSKGGSGDILAGLVAGLVASGYEGRDAALVATYLLGKTAEIHAKSFPAEASTPLRLVSLLPHAWKSLYEEKNRTSDTLFTESTSLFPYRRDR